MEKQNTATQEKTPEDTATVGMFLRHSRLTQKVTIDQVAKALCIRKAYIKAIEESNFQDLPPVPYGMGFVRSYAQYLGLNVERIVQCYKEEAFPKKTAEKTKNMTVDSAHLVSLKPAWKHIVVGILAIIALCGVWLLWFNEPVFEAVPAENEAAFEDVIVEETDEFLTSETENSEAADEAQAVEENEAAPSSRVMLKLNGESWLEVRDDDQIYLTGTYPDGFEYEVPAGEGVRLSIGKRLNVEVYIDGVLTPVARPGRQVNIPLDEYLNH